MKMHGLNLWPTGKRTLYRAVPVFLVMWLIATSPCAAVPPYEWGVGMGVKHYGVLGFAVGAYPWSYDGYANGWTDLNPAWSGVFVQQYNEHGPDWPGQTGFYHSAYASPIPPGGSKTWANIYLWAQNSTPPNEVTLAVVPAEDPRRPIGYLGHLVLDYVPASANWVGPMEYWFELDRINECLVPVVTVTDPLQGTRMHVTVHAVPEPGSIVCLALGGIACMVRRRMPS